MPNAAARACAVETAEARSGEEIIRSTAVRPAMVLPGPSPMPSATTASSGSVDRWKTSKLAR
ncbi:hypothetical protein [Lentzea sp. NBRC 105346]|uniref:hypothetical protein n=1 Tax=Lentzea sp. NBRC 105346 TaxID=3032205 RepID=UPI00255474BB|nr:hypothetical protein [Lentzea sp. NBRC 105346]